MLEGHWPFHNARRNLLIQCFIFLNHVILLIVTINGGLKSWGDVDKIMNLIPVMFTGIGCFVYCIVFFQKQKKLKKLLNEIRRDWELWSSDQEQLIISHYANHGRIYTIFCTASYLGAFFISGVTSLSPQILDIISPLNESRPKEFPFPVYYFVNYPEDYFYWIVIHMIFSCFMETCILVAFESVLAIFTEHACGLFKMIGLQLQKMSSKDSERKNVKTVVFCIEQHNRAVDNIESLYCPCFLFIVFLNGMFLSVSLTQMVVDLNNLDTVLSSGAFIGGCLAHIFFNSLFSQRLIDYSTGLSDVIYDSSWYQMPAKVRKLLLLMMMRGRIPCKLTAGKIFDLSLGNAFAILRLVLKYFTLLLSTTN